MTQTAATVTTTEVGKTTETVTTTAASATTVTSTVTTTTTATEKITTTAGTEQTVPGQGSRPVSGAVSLLDYQELVQDNNWSVALTRALSEYDAVYIPAGVYEMTAISVPSGKIIYGDGVATVIRQKANSLFEVIGSVLWETELAQDMEDFGHRLSLAEDMGLEAGDYVYLLSQRNVNILEDCGYEWCLGRSYKQGRTCFFAEFLQVAEADGREITTQTNAIFPFYYADGSRESVSRKPEGSVTGWPYMREATTVSKIGFVECVTIRDMKIENAKGTTIKAKWARELQIEGLTVCTKEDSIPSQGFRFVSLTQCLDCQIRDSFFHVTTAPATFTGLTDSAHYTSYDMLVLTGCYRCGFEKCRTDFSSHGFHIGKSDKSGTSFGCYVRDSVAENAIWAGVFVTSGCYDSEISHNQIIHCPQGIICAGRKNTIRGNTIEGNCSSGTNYYYIRPGEGGTSGVCLTEGYAIDTIIEDNNISSVCTGVLIRDGYEVTNIFEQGWILIKDNRISDCMSAVVTYRNSAHSGADSGRLEILNNDMTGGKKGSGYFAGTAISFAGTVGEVIISGNKVSGFLILCKPETAPGMVWYSNVVS